MKNLKEAYKDINKFIDDKSLNQDDKFGELFILVCNLIDILSFNNNESRKQILQMLNEYDFEKNREVK